VKKGYAAKGGGFHTTRMTSSTDLQIAVTSTTKEKKSRPIVALQTREQAALLNLAQ
jgi:hypothetical protein